MTYNAGLTWKTTTQKLIQGTGLSIALLNLNWNKVVLSGWNQCY